MKIASLLSKSNLLVVAAAVLLAAVFCWTDSHKAASQLLTHSEWHSEVQLSVDVQKDDSSQIEQLDVVVKNKYEFLDNNIFIRSSQIEVPEQKQSFDFIAIGHWDLEEDYLLFDKVSYQGKDKASEHLKSQIDRFIFHSEQSWHILSLNQDSLLVETVGDGSMVLSTCQDECLQLSAVLNAEDDLRETQYN